ncbi:MAG TPA: DUF1778 domain-containing protein [Acidimicrobiales bacterium]
MEESVRIELRAEPEQEQRIRSAARLEAKSTSAFIMAAALARADEVMAEWSTTTISSSFFDEILDALDQPAPGNDALIRAIERHRLPPAS